MLLLRNRDTLLRMRREGRPDRFANAIANMAIRRVSFLAFYPPRGGESVQDEPDDT
jgi:hypothetical protein